MPQPEIDPELLSDFITESGELIEALDQDLVQLEHEPENLELLNGIFRAMHTTKGSGSFLGLNELMEITHAAEDALNALRKGEVKLATDTMDVLLQAVDVVRGQIDALTEGQPMAAAPQELVLALRAVGASGGAKAAAQAPDTTDQPTGERKLELDGSKMDLLPFMVDDLCSSLKDMQELLAETDHVQQRSQTSARMRQLTEELLRAADFFELEALCAEIAALDEFAAALPDCSEESLGQARPRAAGLLVVVGNRAEALRRAELITAPTETLRQRLTCAITGGTLAAEAVLDAGATAEDALRVDNVVPAAADDAPNDEEAPAEVAEEAPGAIAGDQEQATSKTDPGDRVHVEQTIRVDVARLETLLNLVGELVLQKNRVLGLARRQNQGTNTEYFTQVASDLDRVTGDLQLGVMKMRLQPLNKQFSRYPRVVRDLARNTGKQIDLLITGGETEVDKSVLEGLGDPLVHLLRNCADHGIESPEKRQAAGKDPTGKVHLSAQHEGNHVLIRIIDDGGGIDSQRVGAKAVERGLVTADELESMSPPQILQFVFAPGFSTAETVSDLSGRGVGMDVVRTNIARLNGTVNIDSVQGVSTTVSLKIPLTVAIMPAMMVGVNDALYAIPLTSIVEIVLPEEAQLSTVRGEPVMRLRERVLPVVDLRSRLEAGAPSSDDQAFAVVVALGEQYAALLVTKLIGQQEIVIKPLDDLFEQTRAVSGAMVREDGGVSLIIDVSELLKSTAARNRAAA